MKQWHLKIDLGFSWESPSDVMVNVLDSDIVINEFELQSGYYIYFRTIYLWEDMNSIIPPVMY